MKDLEYSFIDAVRRKKNETLELLSVLKSIEKKLLKGYASLTIEIQYASTIDTLEKMNFACKKLERYRYILTAKTVDRCCISIKRD